MMTDRILSPGQEAGEPQCQFFVVRKKRLCRMTVRPGRRYCGEHEPQPVKEDGQDDTRIPCPYDPKHTCYASKLEKHLTVCNSRLGETPPYIVWDVNAPGEAEAEAEAGARRPLSDLSKDTLMRVIDKVNLLYEIHLKDQIKPVPEQPIHAALAEEFSAPERTETSRRHLRQASSLLHLVEREGLVRDGTCYVELGAGKGQLSYYAHAAWCAAGSGSGVVLLDRAALRHKRDNKLRGARTRLRADLRHVALRRLPAARRRRRVALAKHLCGVATDYALRCVVGAGEAGGAGEEGGAEEGGAAGAALATCCHHACARAGYVANRHLQELGISGDDLNVMFGIVSWATCGDGRSRQRRDGSPRRGRQDRQPAAGQKEEGSSATDNALNAGMSNNDQRGEENAALDIDQLSGTTIQKDAASSAKEVLNVNGGQHGEMGTTLQTQNDEKPNESDQNGGKSGDNGITDQKEDSDQNINGGSPEAPNVPERLTLSYEEKEEVGRRAKVLLDWGRVLYLRDNGFEARLVHYVPSTVSPENVCIVAKKIESHDEVA